MLLDASTYFVGLSRITSLTLGKGTEAEEVKCPQDGIGSGRLGSIGTPGVIPLCLGHPTILGHGKGVLLVELMGTVVYEEADPGIGTIGGWVAFQV